MNFTLLSRPLLLIDLYSVMDHISTKFVLWRDFLLPFSLLYNILFYYQLSYLFILQKKKEEFTTRFGCSLILLIFIHHSIHSLFGIHNIKIYEVDDLRETGSRPIYLV